jgi:Zn2+/Cd2+-exporting ATPase
MLAAPTATVAALGRAAKSGILVKVGQYLERVASVKAVLFDKTGTLT